MATITPVAPPRHRRRRPASAVPAREAPRPRVELDTAAARWQRALDSVDRALVAAGGACGLPEAESAARRRALGEERERTAAQLARLAATAGVRPAPWISPVPVTPAMLGLPAGIDACVFELGSVLVDSVRLHATAWADAFDEFLLGLSHSTGRVFRPFDLDADYRAYVEGRPRLEGVHAFLDSRGIHLPEGRPGDGPAARTAYGLARRKSDVLTRELHLHGVQALPQARRYLEAAGHAGLKRGVVSASANASSMLELAHLDALVDATVDAGVIRAEQLRSRPAPDVLLAACERLGAAPERTVSFTYTPAGVAAAHAGGLTVYGVAAGAKGELLAGFGADVVVAGLGVLLQGPLRAAA